MIDNELKKKFAAFIKANLPSDSDSMSEEDIIWILDECDKGNKPTYDDFVKARRQTKVIESKDIRCKNCKNSSLSFDEEPCKNCLEFDTDQPMAYKHTCFEKKDIVDAMDRSMYFGSNMMRQEEFKIPDSIQIMIDQNKKPNLIIPQLDGIANKVRHTDSVVVGITKTVRDISDSVENLDKNIPSIADCINIKIDKLMEAVESLDAKLDILDQRMHDFRQHQILKDIKYVNQVKEVEKDIFLGKPEPRFKVDDEVQVVDDANRVKYTITGIFWSNGPVSKKGYWYVVESPDKTGRQVQEDLLIPFKKEPPKFKVGDIVKVAHDTKHKDFFVCRIKWSEHSKRWNYLISLDLEDISGAFWRMEGFLTKSEDYIEPLFKVGDKVKLKHGKTVYDVYSITYFMCNKKKVYRYKIGHKATTPHYENENRLIKA